MGGFNRGFDDRFGRFDHFRNRFGFFPGFAGGWDYGYPYADCGYWGRPRPLSLPAGAWRRGSWGATAPFP